MTNTHRSGSEAITFRNKVTGREVRQLTNAPARSVHSYYDIPPWSPVTGQIAFSSMRDPQAERANIYLMDRDGGNITYLSQSQAVSANDGAMAQWSFDGGRVYFRDQDREQRLVGWVEVANGERGSLPGDLRMLSPTANLNAYHTQCRDYPDHEIIRQRESHGLFVQDLETGKIRMLASVEDCRQQHPRRDEIANWHLYIKHSKWSCDGQHIMFVFTNEIHYASKYAELPRVKDVYVVNIDGGNLKRVGEFGNHPIWHPNGREVLTNSPFPDRPGNSLVLTDVETGARRLAATSISGAGHPSFSPDGSRIAVDHVLAREGYGSINLVYVAEDTVEHLVDVRVLDHSHVGTHLHPVWSRDGRQILFASDATGVAQLCVIDV